MATIIYDNETTFDALKDRTIAIMGYGSQGHAHALNLHESGLNVIVGLRNGSPSWAKAEADGLKVMSVAEAAKTADVIMILLPDEKQASVYYSEIEPNLKAGDALAFAHGFNIHYNQIVPPKSIDVFMVAPKGPGHIVRRTYTEGIGVPGLIAVYQDATGNARDIGATRAGVYETTFREETETDLFGEQVDLCGGLSALIKTAFEVLVEAGYQPEMAYFETCHEVKLIVDLIYEGGLETVGPKIINEQSRKSMYEALERIQNGEFAKEFVLEGMVNHPVLKAMERQEKEHQLEVVGKQIRANIPWLNKKIDDD